MGDLEIDRENPGGQAAGNGFGDDCCRRASIRRPVWYGVMRIPFSAIDSGLPEKGRELRAGSIASPVSGMPEHYAWRPTGQTSFHVPQAFGTIRRGD